LHATARHAGKSLDQDYAFILRIRDGQVIEVWEAWTDGAAWNDFWS
jgi:ketosteroid isomerase-like protein